MFTTVPPIRRLFSPSPADEIDEDILAVLHAEPKVALPFPRRKSLIYAFICMLWLLFGIFGRDPWKPEETLLVAAVSDFINPPALVDETQYGLSERPQLYIQLAAATAMLTAGWLPLHEGARLANLLLLIGGFVCLGLAAARLYGTRTAWLAVLLLVGCFGFMVRAHVLNFGVPAFFGMAMALLGAAVLADDRRYINQVPISGCLIGVGSVFLLLTSGGVAAVIALTPLALAKKAQSAVHVVAAVFFLPFLLWTLWAENPFFLVEPSRFSSPANFLTAVGDTLRVAAWSLLPLLPLAAYGLWYSYAHKKLLDRFLVFCIAAVLLGCLAFLLNGNNEEDYYFLLPPLALLAAAMLQKMPNGTASIMDLFAMLIGFCAVGILWLAWLALVWQSAGWLQELLPGHTLPPVSGGKVAFALLLTAAWIVVIRNFGRNNERAVVNFSCGITLVWAVFSLLLLGFVDSGKSYRPPAAAVLAVTNDACLTAPTNTHWRAQLSYFGVLLGDERCPYYLSATKEKQALRQIARAGSEEKYYLYRRF